MTSDARSPLVWIALLSICAAFLYFHRLGSTPPYLSIEEVYQARQAVDLATTGRNANGELLPLYFPENAGRTVRDPVWIYSAAALLTVLPFSEALVRVPSACAGILNVVLIFIVGREVFGRTRPAVIAALLLMLTPAHFLQSRIATMQIGPVTCVLAWLVFIVRYINKNRYRDLFVATLCLGLGMYTYVAALVIMPVYFLVTVFVVRRHDAGSRSTTAASAACAGFALALLPLAMWCVLHPRQLIDLAGYYTHGEYNKDLGLEGFVGAKAIGHFDAWWDCYNPDKLFFSGDPDLRFSTRTAGYFLLTTSVPMAIGIWCARRLLKFEIWIVLLSGLALAPLPGVLVSNSEIKRWLTFTPFAILAATCGTEWMLAEGRRTMNACAIVLLLLGAVQAKSFLDYYFGPYRVDSSGTFGGNLRDAIHEILSVSGSQDCVLFDVSAYYLEHQWDLYTRAYGRLDLAKRTTTRLEETLMCRGVTVLTRPGDSRFADWRSTPIPELDGTVRFAVYRR